LKCIFCGGFIVLESNICRKVGDVIHLIDTIYECENGHRFTKSDAKTIKRKRRRRV